MKDRSLKERITDLKQKLADVERELKDEKDAERQPSQRMSLDMQTKKVQEEIGLLQAEERAVKREELVGRMIPILAELRTERLSQAMQWEQLRKLYPLAEAVEKLCGARERWRRIDHVKCLILDPNWRARKLPHVLTITRAAAGVGPYVEGASRLDPKHEKDEVFEFISWRQAEKLKREGKVRNVDEGNAVYDLESIPDPRPPLLDVVRGLDLGAPVPDPATGEILPEFQAAQKELGGDFRLNFETVDRLASEERRKELWKHSAVKG